MTLLVLAECLLLALAQDAAPPVFPAQAAYDHLMSCRYLSALTAAEDGASEPPDPMWLDVLGLAQSYVGLEQRALETFDRQRGTTPRDPIDASPMDDAEALAAIPAIVAAAAGRRIVVLNESHHMPRHRAFAAELVRALRAEGFDTFAAETFADVEGTVARGYPTGATGFYTAEPVFGELVREVLDLGYRLVPYEMEGAGAAGPDDMLARIRERETAQARNLQERVFEVHPDARLFVYVGYSHATEDWTDRGGENEQAWMAARLAALTGFDPLTIDQTVGSPRSVPAHDHPDLRRAQELGRLPGSRVFRFEDGTFFTTGSYAGKVDVQVFHPRVEPVHGRPGWLARGRQALAIPEALAAQFPDEGRVLLQAFHVSEGADAIPADQFVLVGDERPSFLLRAGEYRLRAESLGAVAESPDTFAVD